MKLRYISIIIAACALCSCKDALDLKPLDSFTDVSYWSTVNDLKLYANGLYTLLPGPSASLDNESDDMVTTNYSSYLFNETSVPASGGNWSFTNIRNCNFFLARYQTVEGNEADINMYVAEVRFFRSLQYFDMVKRFGDVPWYEKDLTTQDTEELYKGRDNKYMVVGKIIEDLEFAITIDIGATSIVWHKGTQNSLVCQCDFLVRSAPTGHGRTFFHLYPFDNRRNLILIGQISLGVTIVRDAKVLCQKRAVAIEIVGNIIILLTQQTPAYECAATGCRNRDQSAIQLVNGSLCGHWDQER